MRFLRAALMRLPSKQVYLGQALGLWIEYDGHQQTFDFEGTNYGVSCNATGTLVIIMRWLPGQIDIGEGFEAERALFKRWADFDSTHGHKTIIDVQPDHFRGYAMAVTYRDSKWDHKTRNYKHRYKPNNCKVWASSRHGKAQVFGICQRENKRIVNARGLLG